MMDDGYDDDDDDDDDDQWSMIHWRGRQEDIQVDRQTGR